MVSTAGAVKDRVQAKLQSAAAITDSIESARYSPQAARQRLNHGFGLLLLCGQAAPPFVALAMALRACSSVRRDT